MSEGNPYYEFFKYSLQQSADSDDGTMLGGKFYDPKIGHIYSAASRFRERGHGLVGPFYSFRGDGFGTFLSRLFQWSQPLLKILGQKAIDSAGNIAANVASDAIQGENILESVKKHGAAEGKQLIGDVPGVVEGFLSNKNSHAPSAAISLDSEPRGVRANRKHSGKKNSVRGFPAKKTKKIRGRGGGNKRPKQQRGSGSISALYPALKFMQ